MEFETKQTSDGKTIYRVKAPEGVKMLSLGYFPSVERAEESYNNYMNNNG